MIWGDALGCAWLNQSRKEFFVIHHPDIVCGVVPFKTGLVYKLKAKLWLKEFAVFFEYWSWLAHSRLAFKQEPRRLVTGNNKVNLLFVFRAKVVK